MDSSVWTTAPPASGRIVHTCRAATPGDRPVHPMRSFGSNACTVDSIRYGPGRHRKVIPSPGVRSATTDRIPGCQVGHFCTSVRTSQTTSAGASICTSAARTTGAFESIFMLSVSSAVRNQVTRPATCRRGADRIPSRPAPACQRAGPVASRRASTAMIRRFISSTSSARPSFWKIEPMCFSTARSLR